MFFILSYNVLNHFYTIHILLHIIFAQFVIFIITIYLDFIFNLYKIHYNLIFLSHLITYCLLIMIYIIIKFPITLFLYLFIFHLFTFEFFKDVSILLNFNTIEYFHRWALIHILRYLY